MTPFAASIWRITAQSSLKLIGMNWDSPDLPNSSRSFVPFQSKLKKACAIFFCSSGVRLLATPNPVVGKVCDV
jgi:hypothetical protein